MNGDVAAARPAGAHVTVQVDVERIDLEPLKNVVRLVVRVQPLVHAEDLEDLLAQPPGTDGPDRSARRFGPVGHADQHADGPGVEVPDPVEVEDELVTPLRQPRVENCPQSSVCGQVQVPGHHDKVGATESPYVDPHAQPLPGSLLERVPLPLDPLTPVTGVQTIGPSGFIAAAQSPPVTGLTVRDMPGQPRC